MFRRPSPGVPTPPVQPSPQAAAAAAAASPNPALASSLLQAVAAQAFAANGAPSASTLAQAARSATPSTATTAAPIHMATNPASFHNVLKTHRVVVAFFTSQTCPPCRMIEPAFERLAHDKTQTAGVGGGGGVAFVKVDLGAGMGNAVGAEYGVRVTPTFLFFKDGNKASNYNVVRTFIRLRSHISRPMS